MFIDTIDSDSLHAYYRKISKFNVLTKEQEQLLIHEYYVNGDIEAKTQLIHSMLKFVSLMSKKYRSFNLPMEDIIQYANIGLLNAVEKFSPSYGVRMSTYAKFHIRYEIHEFIIKNWKIVKMATTKAQRKLFLTWNKHQKSANVWLSDIETKAIADKLNVTPKDVTMMESRMKYGDVQIDALVTDDESSYLVGLNMPNDEDTAKTIEAYDYKKFKAEKFKKFLEVLDYRRQHIIVSRYLTDPPVEFNQLATKFGISQQRTKQLEVDALAKLRKQFEELV